MILPIDKNIEIPAARYGITSSGAVGKGYAPTARVLQPDESFFAPIALSTASAMIAQIKKTEPSRSFVTRKWHQDGVDGTRIWRTK